MLSGNRAFEAATATDTMFAIVKEQPASLTAARPGISSAVDQIVEHCLEKSPAERFQSAQDVAFALESLSGTSSGSTAKLTDPIPRRTSTARTIALSAFIVVLAIGMFWIGRQTSVTAGPFPTEWEAERLGGPATAFGPRISPDGKLLAFQAIVNGQTQVGVM